MFPVVFPLEVFPLVATPEIVAQYLLARMLAPDDAVAAPVGWLLDDDGDATFELRIDLLRGGAVVH